MANVLANGLSRGAVEEISRRQGEPEWMLQKRLQAWETFESLPAPLGRRGDLGTLRTFANFKFQQLTPYAASEGLTPTIEQSLQTALASERAGLIVQRNSSVVHSELSEELKSQGVILTSLENAAREYPELVREYFMTRCIPVETDKYTAMNATFWSGGIFLYIPKGVEIEQPILGQVWIDAPGAIVCGHTLIIADELSSVRYVEEYNSDFADEAPSLFNGVVEVYTRSGAHVEFSSMQDFGMNVWNITHRNVVEENDGSTTWVMADLGSKAMLSEIGSGLSGNGSAAELVGVFFTDHDQRYAINSLANHIGLSTNAETMVKGALSGESRVEFSGMIRIQPKAQYTASFLSDHTLLLSDKCRAESIPGLEIGANEVSASHGATSGKIDEEQLFYLMVRGIPQDEAERIIVQGFFEPVLQRIPLENLRVRLRRSIVRRMRGAYETEADTWVDAQERWEIEGVDEGAVHLDERPAENEIQLTEY
jgi:Fe-S cluster assembly protein SufD